jgi:hypothetical protein
MAALEPQLPLFAEGTVSEEEIQERVPPSTRTAPRELPPSGPNRSPYCGRSSLPGG